MENRVAVITGASSGIGAALARQLGSRGLSLVLAARRDRELRMVAAESGAETLVVPMDVTRRSEHERLRDLTLEKFGHIDVWVNNAGSAITKTVMELTDKEVDDIIAVVLKSVLYGMQTIIPHFQERGEGHLINVSSFLGRVPLITNRSIYSAMKSGVNILTADLRVDLMAKYPRIHVSTVMPGVVDTPFHAVAKTPVTFKAGGRAGPLQVQSADEVASQIVALIENPKAELYTDPAQPELARQYYQDVGEFERNLVRRLSHN